MSFSRSPVTSYSYHLSVPLSHNLIFSFRSIAHCPTASLSLCLSHISTASQPLCLTVSLSASLRQSPCEVRQCHHPSLSQFYPLPHSPTVSQSHCPSVPFEFSRCLIVLLPDSPNSSVSQCPTVSVSLSHMMSHLTTYCLIVPLLRCPSGPLLLLF